MNLKKGKTSMALAVAAGALALGACAERGPVQVERESTQETDITCFDTRGFTTVQTHEGTAYGSYTWQAYPGTLQYTSTNGEQVTVNNCNTMNTVVRQKTI